MASSKSALASLFNKLHHGEHDSVTSLIPEALREYRTVSKELNREERLKVNYIKSLIDYCTAGRWLMASHLLAPAFEEFNRYFLRKLVQRSERPAHVNFDQPSNIARHGQGHYSRPTSKGGHGESISSRRKESADQKRGTRPETDLSDLSSIPKIVDKFGEIFRNEWKDALNELEDLKVPEQDAITGLLRIVMDAYKFCTMEADTQISKIEKAIHNIIFDGISTNHKLDGKRSLLLEYRRDVAGVCLDRLQESFRRRHLPEIIRSVGIYQSVRTHGPVHKYTDQCVTICWAMSVCDPQLYLVDDRSVHGPFNDTMYNEYTMSGKSVAFYVWPPLQTSKYGKLLSKGVAQCHL